MTETLPTKGDASEAVDLLPCPFCGSEAEIERLGNHRQSTIYACTDCGCSLETGEEWGHGRRWNTRTPNTLQNEEVIGADRREAWPFRPSCYKDDARANWDAGVYDRVPVIQAFRNHRLSTRREGDSGRAA
jgi:hypothetical protein